MNVTVQAIRAQIAESLDSTDPAGRKVANATWGVYCFFDFDGEPLYVGQTCEKLRTRVRRHLTNRRSDAATTGALDPDEVCWIEMWPLWEYEHAPKVGVARVDARAHLNALEYSVERHVLANARFKALMNEQRIIPTTLVDLPESLRVRTVPDHLMEALQHPDQRIPQRTKNLNKLADVIASRDVSAGLRRTYQLQVLRLLDLADRSWGRSL